MTAQVIPFAKVKTICLGFGFKLELTNGRIPTALIDRTGVRHTIAQVVEFFHPYTDALAGKLRLAGGQLVEFKNYLYDRNWIESITLWGADGQALRYTTFPNSNF